MVETKLTFKEMCDQFDVTPRTLRYYEYIELLAPEKDGRNRFYGSREVARMTLIMRGRRWGFSLEELRQWLQMYEKLGSRKQMEVLVEASERRLEALMHERAQLDQAIDELRATRDQVKKDLEAGRFEAGADTHRGSVT